MSSIIPIVLFSVFFLLFAINKEYIQILVTLIIMLIIDFAVVKGFSNTIFFGAIVLSVGMPFISILIYAIVKMILMGIFYFLLQKNYIIAFIGYLALNIFLNACYMTISGNVFIDIIFNSIIAGIIIILYNKFEYLNELKWFSISAIVVNFILETSISSLFFT